MTTAASGCITKAEERIRDMLANCTAFQTWVGAADATAAKSSIYYDTVPRGDYMDDSDALAWHVSVRPFALIWTDYENGFAMNELVGGSGTLQIRFEQNTPGATQTDWEEADRLFKNTLGGIIHSGDTDSPGLWELSITRQYTQLSRVNLDALYRTAEDEYETFGDAQAAVLSVAWGVTR